MNDSSLLTRCSKNYLCEWYGLTNSYPICFMLQTSQFLIDRLIINYPNPSNLKIQIVIFKEIRLAMDMNGYFSQLFLKP